MKSNKKRQYSKLSKRILNRFFLSLLILLAVMMGGYFLAWFICKQFIWYDYSPFYSLFKTLQMLSPVIVLVVMAVGSITFMRKDRKTAGIPGYRHRRLQNAVGTGGPRHFSPGRALGRGK